MNMEQYCEIVCDILEILPPTTTIERIAGTGYSETTIEPLWVNRRFEILNMIDISIITKSPNKTIKYINKLKFVCKSFLYEFIFTKWKSSIRIFI